MYLCLSHIGAIVLEAVMPISSGFRMRRAISLGGDNILNPLWIVLGIMARNRFQRANQTVTENDLDNAQGDQPSENQLS